MTRSLVAGLLLAASASVSLPNSTEAQLGGLIKKKITDAVKKPEPEKPGDQKAAQSRNDPGVLELTQSSFDAAIRGVTAEVKLQEPLRTLVAKYPTFQEYEACKSRAGQTPEAQKIAMSFAEIPQGLSAEETQKRITAMGMRMDSLQKKLCPYDPNDLNKLGLREKLDSIHNQVAAEGGFASTRQYDILVERIEGGCSVRVPGFAERAMSTKTDAIPGMRPGNMVAAGAASPYVFTPSEDSVLNAANCNRYADVVKQLIR